MSDHVIHVKDQNKERDRITEAMEEIVIRTFSLYEKVS